MNPGRQFRQLRNRCVIGKTGNSESNRSIGIIVIGVFHRSDYSIFAIKPEQAETEDDIPFRHPTYLGRFF